MGDLSSSIRDQTHAPCIGSLESQLQQHEHLDTSAFPSISNTDTKHLLQRGFAEWMIKSPTTIMCVNHISPFLKLVSKEEL